MNPPQTDFQRLFHEMSIFVTLPLPAVAMDSEQGTEEEEDCGKEQRSQETVLGLPLGQANESHREQKSLETQTEQTQQQHTSLQSQHHQLQKEHECLQGDYKSLLADHERLGKEHEMLQASHTRLLAEHEQLQAEHRTQQAELQVLLLEREAIQLARKMTDSIVRRTDRADRKHKNSLLGNHGDCNAWKKAEAKSQQKETKAGVAGETKLRKAQTKLKHSEQTVAKAEDLSSSEILPETKPARNRKRKQRDTSTGIDKGVDSNKQGKPTTCGTKKKKTCKESEVDTTVPDTCTGNLSSPELSEEEDLKDLKISFDPSIVSSEAGCKSPGSVYARSSCGHGDGVFSQSGGKELGGLTNGYLTQTSVSDVNAGKEVSKSCRSSSDSGKHKREQGSKFVQLKGHCRNHLRTQQGNSQKHQCPKCPEAFPSTDLLVPHTLTHLTPRQQHACSHCRLGFLSNTALRKHIHRHHNKKVRVKKKLQEFRCRTCGETFAKNSDLSIHMRGIHSDSKPFKCSECDAAFPTRSNLTVHARKHSGEKRYGCTECEASFPRSADLKSHARKHSALKPHVCSQCSASFCRAGDLKPHMRTHTGEKPFQCEECGAAFATSSNLAVHRRTHTGERPFQCEQCGAAFTQLGHLTRHRSQHATENDFHCPTCSATFGNQYKLKVHMQRHNTDNTFKCTKCGAAFSRASVLTEHMRIHTGEKPYKCNLCPASFARSANLMAHKRKHTGERPYVCPHCKQGFTQSTSLTRHLQSRKACLARQGQVTPDPNPPTTTQDARPKDSHSAQEEREDSSFEKGQNSVIPEGDTVSCKVGEDSGCGKQQVEASSLCGADGDRNSFLSSSKVLGKQQVEASSLCGADGDRNFFLSSSKVLELGNTATLPSAHFQSLHNMRNYAPVSSEKGDRGAECCDKEGTRTGSDLEYRFYSFAQPSTYSETPLPAKALHLQQTRSQGGEGCVSFHMSSGGEGMTKTTLLPPISMMADFQTDMSGVGSSLTALQTLTHTGAFLPDTASVPPPPQESPSHRQAHYP